MKTRGRGRWFLFSMGVLGFCAPWLLWGSTNILAKLMLTMFHLLYSEGAMCILTVCIVAMWFWAFIDKPSFEGSEVLAAIFGTVVIFAMWLVLLFCLGTLSEFFGFARWFFSHLSSAFWGFTCALLAMFAVWYKSFLPQQEKEWEKLTSSWRVFSIR